MTSPKDIREILISARTIAVVGLSNKPDRPSHQVSSYMQAAGYRVIPVTPLATEILGERCYATLEDIPEPVDIVNVFRQAELTPPIAESAVKIGAKTLWLQLGIAHERAATLAQNAGMRVIMDRCIKIDHAKLCPHQPDPSESSR